MVIVTNSFPPINEEAIEQFENENQIMLPEDFKQFLLNRNGGVPDLQGVDVKEKDNTKSRVVEFIFGLAPDSAGTLQHVYRIAQKRLPKNILPIARGGKHSFAMSLRKEDYGHIYFDNSDEVDRDGRSSYDNLYQIADSFTEFLEKLYE